MNSPDAATGMQLAQMGRYADALPYLEKANRLAPADVPVLHAVASLLQWTGRGTEAVERYRIACEALPDNPDVLSGWARALLLLGEQDQAFPLLDRALQIDQQYADSGGLLALLMNELGDNDAVCDVLGHLVERNPEHARLLFQYAKALVDAEYLQDAQAVFERYRTLRPEDPQASVELGILASYFGDTHQAVKEFQAALRIDPDHAPAWWEITLANDAPLDSQTVERMSRLAQTVQDPKKAADYHDILARHYDSIGEFAAAAANIERAHSVLSQLVPPNKRYSMDRRERDRRCHRQPHT